MLQDTSAYTPSDFAHLARYGVHSLEVALDAMPVCVAWARLDDQTITFMNRKFLDVFGYSLCDFTDVASWIDSVHPPEDRPLVWSRWRVPLASPGVSEQTIEAMEVRCICKDGQVRTVIHSGVILPAAGWSLATFVDITDRKHSETLLRTAERKARENEAVYRFLLERSPGMIILSSFAPAGRRYASPAVEEITGFTAEEYLSHKPADLVHPDDFEKGAQMMQRLRAGDMLQSLRYRARRKDGTYCWVEGTVNGYTDPDTGELAGYVATVRDISEEHEREQKLLSEHSRLTEEAARDELTGIPNRRAFNRAFKLETSRLRRASGDLSVALVDVDYFKRYNDSCGHLAGDLCLQRIADTMRTTLRRGVDLVARYGGEEFVILMPMTSLEGAARIAGEIVGNIAALDIRHAESPHGCVTVSIGVACWPRGADLDPVDFLDRTDEALYQAKRAGRNRFVLAVPGD